MQGLPIEGGGFRGRTNKLVDGCYSWWCAGAFPLLRALMPEDFPGLSQSALITLVHLPHHSYLYHVRFSDQQESFDLFDRQALQEYILLVSQDLTPQAKQGGLRDKPSAMPDMYHTHYILSGLSLAQHSQKHSLQRIEELKKAFKTPDYSKSILGNSESESEGFERMKEIYSRALAWEVEQEKELVVGLVSNKVVSLSLDCFSSLYVPLTISIFCFLFF
jgi:protein farnesyltransferase subunit beta